MSALAQARARQALADAGLNSDVRLEPLRSPTNEVWMTGEYIVRLNRRHDQRLFREATLGPALPPEVCYPEIVCYGGEVGGDFLVFKRVPGTVLSKAWPSMGNVDRQRAILQLCEMLRALHRTPVPEGLPEIDDPPLLRSVAMESPTQPVVQALSAAAQLANVDPGITRAATEVIRDCSLALEPFDAPTYVHGDVHFENVMWDGQRVTTLLDYKWARPGPPDLDLDVLLRFCAFPFLHVAEDYRAIARAEDYMDVPWSLAEGYPELFSIPRQFDRMRVYAIAYDVRELLLFPPPLPPDRLSEHHPYHRLHRTVAGQSHLDRLEAAA